MPLDQKKDAYGQQGDTDDFIHNGFKIQAPLLFTTVYKPKQKQKHDRSDERANEGPQKIVRRNAEQAKNKSAQNGTNDPDNKVANQAETAAFDHRTRQKSSGNTNENKPEPVHNI